MSSHEILLSVKSGTKKLWLEDYPYHKTKQTLKYLSLMMFEEFGSVQGKIQLMFASK